jgi:hypothetical protein
MALLVVGVVVSASAGQPANLRGPGPATEVMAQVAKLAAVARAKVEKTRSARQDLQQTDRGHDPEIQDRVTTARSMVCPCWRALGPMRLDLPPPVSSSALA